MQMMKTWRRGMLKRAAARVSGLVFLALSMAGVAHGATTYTITGNAGFETGLQHLALLRLDRNMPVTVNWGDGTPNNSGLLDCKGILWKKPCYVDGTHVYMEAGPYKITITYYARPTFGALCGLFPSSCHPQKKILGGATADITSVAQNSFVILTIGDSVASGEGSPDVSYDSLLSRYEAYWDDPPSDYNHSNLDLNDMVATNTCHRSSWSGFSRAAAEVAANNPGITAINVACSGNTVDQAIDSLTYARQHLPRIDVLVISVGADNIDGGFGTLIWQCLVRQARYCPRGNVLGEVSELQARYQHLAEAINCQWPDANYNPSSDTDETNNIDEAGSVDSEPVTCDEQEIPKLVLITEYYDPTDEGGAAIPAKIKVSVPVLNRLAWLYDNVEFPMDREVDKFARLALNAGLTVPSYAVTGLESDFDGHGYYDLSQGWVNTFIESCEREGEPYCQGPNQVVKSLFPGASGTGHPNIPKLIYEEQDSIPSGGILGRTLRIRRPLAGCSDKVCGQGQYQEYIYNAINEYNPPVVTASAIQGQGETSRTYQFNTWTSKNVTVSLYSVNAISAAGVGTSYYAVDNPSCTSTPLAIQNCKTYSGAFTIDTSGQHTVTFFGTNGQGHPEQLQTVQVLIDKSGNRDISISPSTQTVSATQGQDVEYSVALGRIGWDQPSDVTLTCTTTANGTCSMQPSDVSVNGSTAPTSTAEISIPGCTSEEAESNPDSDATSGTTTCIPPADGTYTVTVTAVSGTSANSASATLIIDTDPSGGSASAALAVGSGPSKDDTSAVQVVDSDPDPAAKGNR